MHALPGHVVARTRLYAALSALTLVPATSAFAGIVQGPGQSATVTPASPLEAWRAADQATLTIDGGAALTVAVDSGATLIMNGGSATGSRLTVAALELSDGASATLDGATLTNATGRGLSLFANSMTGGSAPTSAVVHASTITGGLDGASVSGGSTLTVDRGSTLTGTSAASSGVRLVTGAVNLMDGSLSVGQKNGVIVADATVLPGEDHGRTLVIDGATAQGIDGSAIFVDDVSGVHGTVASIALRNGATLIGGNGVAVEAESDTIADVAIAGSDIAGDMLATGTGVLRVDLTDAASSVTGRMTGVTSLTQAAGSTWTMTGDSDVSAYVSNGGVLAITPASVGTPATLTVRGNYGGSGGTFALNTVLNAGGALANQVTDRVLIEGDVTTTGPTALVVTGSGGGALTDTNQNGAVDAGEGISLVQVGGASRADAFVLHGGYVAAGPWQYTLHAFGPGQTDPAQNALANGLLGWDYRLGNTFVCDGDCEPVTPVEPPVVPPVEPPVEPGREAVVPQVPSYLSAPAALLTYGDMLGDGLRQRLGDIRSGTSHDPVGGEMFARYLGGQLRYTSNLSFKRFGYDFDQQVNALQLGGSLVALDGDNGTLRAGWAADHGTTRVSPKAVDGHSSAKYRATGIAGWVTWQHGSGLWVDGVLGATRFRGDVGSDARGADVARVRALGWSMSVETGMPIALGGEWTVEPRFQLKHQQVNFRDFLDVDGLAVSLGTAKRTTALAGARIARSADARFMPYVGLDLIHSTGGDPTTDVASAEWGVEGRFRSGRVGNGYRVAAGLTSQLTDHVQLYGEGTWRHFVGGYGMQGWAGNVGVRVTF